MGPRRHQPLRLPTPGTQGTTPDSADHGRVVFPSTPQYTQGPHRPAPIDQFGHAATPGGPPEAARPRIPRSKSSGDVNPLPSRFSHRAPVGGLPGPPLTLPGWGMQGVSAAMASHAVVQHVEGVQIASQQGACAYREGFTDAALGVGRMHVTPTDVLVCLAAASAKSAAAASAANEGYAAWPTPSSARASRPVSGVQSPTATSPTTTLPTYADAARGGVAPGGPSDKFIHIPRLAIASVTFYAAGHTAPFGGSEAGAIKRERSIAQLHAAQHNRAALEIRTRDCLLVTLCFSSAVKATDAVIHELLRPPSVNLFRASPLRPLPHHLYGVSSLALRLQYPMKLVAAGLNRASGAGGGAPHGSGVGLDLGPTVTGQTPPGDVTDPLQVSTPEGHNAAAFPTLAPSATVPAGHGWFVYDAMAEFERQQRPRWRPSARGPPAEATWDPTWPVRPCHVNADYAVCPSYPPVLFVPRDATDQMVIDEAKNRTRSRVQTCAYVYEPTRNCLFRSSQPRNGTSILGWMVTADESPLMRCIRRSCAAQELKVVDLRPYANAVANVFRGGGHEATRRKGTEVLFANIENVDHVNTAYFELAQLCLAHHSASDCARSAVSTPSAFLAAVAKTKWLDLLHAVLGASVRVARFIAGSDGTSTDHHPTAPRTVLRASSATATSTGPAAAGHSGAPAGCNVLIHCSDGWDRTAQVSALAQLLLDPWFRTVRGFCVLVEKEFLHCGHQFASRAHFPRVTTLGAHDLPSDASFRVGSRSDVGATPVGAESVMQSPQKGAARGAPGWDALDDPAMDVQPAGSDGASEDGWDRSDCPDHRSDCASPNLNRTPPAVPHGQSRPAHGAHARVKVHGGGHEACPIFVQFVDAVHQLVEAYPAEFEFTTQALIWLLDAYHSGFYSTFSCDNHAELLASGLVGRHTANALAELAMLGGVYPQPGASEASSAKSGMQGMPQRPRVPSASSYVDVGSLQDHAHSTAADAGNSDNSPAASDAPQEVATPPPTSVPSDGSLVGPLVNASYSWAAASTTGPLLGLIGPQRVRLWEEYFCRFSDAMQPVAVAGRQCVPESALAPKRLSKLAAAGGSFESFDALSASMAEWQSVGGSRVSSPNNHGDAYPAGQRPPALGTPGGPRGDDSPAPPSPGKPARIAASQMRMPAFQAKKLQENWN